MWPLFKHFPPNGANITEQQWQTKPEYDNYAVAIILHYNTILRTVSTETQT